MNNNTEKVYQELVDAYGVDDVFTTKELEKRFEVIAFSAPFVSVIDKKTGVRGYLQFIHHPRFYFYFTAC